VGVKSATPPLPPSKILKILQKRPPSAFIFFEKKTKKTSKNYKKETKKNQMSYIDS
jgi:hypothetical protein